MGKPEDLIKSVEDRPGHDFRYSLDSSKIRSELNWSENTNFDEGLEKTVEWYLSNPNWWKNTSQDILKPMPWKN